MSDIAQPDLEDILNEDSTCPDDWQDAMITIAEQEGYFKALDPDHYVFYLEAGNNLMVCFEPVETIAQAHDLLPSLYGFARKEGWSLMVIIAKTASFWRSQGVFSHFDQLSQSDFFDAFDNVLFYGAGAAGYAAGAYSASAPGAHGLLIAPYATLDRARNPWPNPPHNSGAADQGPRYSHAPEMVEACAKLWVIHDPSRAEESTHAALFAQDWVEHIAMHNSFGRAQQFMRESGTLEGCLRGAMTGELNALSFYRAWRERRNCGSYLRTLLRHAQSKDRLMHEFMICRSVTQRLRLPIFHKRMKHLRQIPQFQQVGT